MIQSCSLWIVYPVGICNDVDYSWYHRMDSNHPTIDVRGTTVTASSAPLHLQSARHLSSTVTGTAGQDIRLEAPTTS